MKALVITNCSDEMFWYRSLIGAMVPFVREEEDCYLSRDTGGYLNIVKFQDAKIIDVDEFVNSNKLNWYANIT